MFGVLDKKHHSEWLSVLEHLVQLTKQQQSNNHATASSLNGSLARKHLSVEEFTDLLIVKKTAELYIKADFSSSEERLQMCTLFYGSLSHQETNKLLVNGMRSMCI